MKIIKTLLKRADSVHRWLVVRIEKVDWYMHSLNARIKIEVTYQGIVDRVVQLNFIEFFNYRYDGVKVDPLYFQRAIDEIIMKIYNDSRQVIAINVVVASGNEVTIRYVKARKTLKYADYMSIVYHLKMLLRIIYPSRAYRHMFNSTAKLSCKERKYY